MPRPRHAPAGRGALRPVLAGVAVVVAAVVVFAVVAAAGGGHRTVAARRAPGLASAPTTAAPAPVATATTAPAATTTPTSPLPPAGDGAEPQTSTRPTAGTPAFDAEMADLWSGVTSDQVAAAMPAFFPEAAYAQLKAYDDDGADWTDRLVAHFQLDLGAAHQELGPAAATATLVEVLVPSSGVSWIPSGVCSNRLGYWHVGGARLVYDVGGQERSIGIASMISWRGYWYVVHLGSVDPPAGRGIVASPSSGTGHPGGYGGC